MTQQGTPAGFITQTVDIRIIKGRYIPCRTCHWFGVCIVPKGNFLPKFREYFGSDDIRYNDNDGVYAGRTIYHCLEYTIKPK